MPRKVTQEEKDYIAALIKSDIPQRDIERELGVSRLFIRKIAKEIGYQFPRNGIENVGVTCICLNCGAFFRRPKSKVIRANKSFCSEICKNDYMRGENASAWKDGSSIKSFSSWIVNTAGYKEWREKVLEKYNFKCAISGRDYNLDCHHIEFKRKEENYHKALDPENGIVLNKDVHREIHTLASQGKSFDESVKILKEKYKNQGENNGK